MKENTVSELLKSVDLTLNDIQESILQQGIILKVTMDMLLEKNIIDKSEFDEKIISVSKDIQDKINKLEKNIDSNSNSNNSTLYGKGGIA